LLYGVVFYFVIPFVIQAFVVVNVVVGDLDSDEKSERQGPRAQDPVVHEVDPTGIRC
jgi:thiamine pyrophosphokinase